MAASRVLKLYTADDGTEYRVLIPAWVAALPAPAPGFLADDASKAFLPRGMRMRYITLKDPVSLRHRKLHCGSATSAAWTTVSAAITLPNIDATSTVYTSQGQVGQKLRAP